MERELVRKVPADRGDWQSRAHCVKIDPRALAPGRRDTPYITRDLCRRCPVQPTCLGWALVTDVPGGMFGGLTLAERRRLRAELTRRLDGRPMAGSAELAAVVRANTASPAVPVAGE